ncbi:uncharacterized protein LOC125488080 [Rhincodon typus]|uniref:uncharacterized protein LOC125488080 n=1 Tax=Rhincodon typus TaxID=259920 RepID=UPI00202FAAFE|nr:uncharacterized protein LOC125488080 [Rhincodon typus]
MLLEREVESVHVTPRGTECESQHAARTTACGALNIAELPVILRGFKARGVKDHSEYRWSESEREAVTGECYMVVDTSFSKYLVKYVRGRKESEKTVAVVLGTVTTVSSLKKIFWYFALTSEYQQMNFPWFRAALDNVRSSPVWLHSDRMDQLEEKLEALRSIQAAESVIDRSFSEVVTSQGKKLRGCGVPLGVKEEWTSVSRREQCLQKTDKEGEGSMRLVVAPSREVTEMVVHDLLNVDAANLATIWILSQRKCGLSKCVIVYMLAMATTDLLVLINNVILYHIFSYHFPLSFLSYTSICRLIIYMTAFTPDLSVWCIVSFTFDRFVAICCQKFQTKYCTKRTAIMLLIAITVVIVLKEIPVLFAYEPEKIINKIQWGCRSDAAFFASSAGIGYVWFYSACVIWIPFTLIILCNSLTVQRIVLANRTRTGLRSSKNRNQRDSEMENRRKSIILLFSISVSFLLLWLTNAVSLGVTKLTGTVYYRGKFTNPAFIAIELGNALKFFSCLLNPFIYAATQSKFRAELKNMVKFPWILFDCFVRQKPTK